MPTKFSLFSIYGIEAEYMIVNRDSLKVLPIADKVIAKLNNGKIVNEVELGEVAWSNELVNHVLEIKTSPPAKQLEGLDKIFHRSILDINEVLKGFDAALMPSAMHPWFAPQKEMVLWPHGQREIYKLYDEIFDCRGHGWSNLQSIHINLPYATEAEFVKLHTAIRAVIPIIPAIAASSPFYEGGATSLACNRLAFYEKNQAKIPSIIGNIIPENVQSTKEYKEILKGVYQDISHYDHAKTLQHPWLNSRAAIPKFDVGAIEIRLMDIQECPYMDMTIVALVVHLVNEITQSEDLLLKAAKLSDSLLRNVYESSKQFEHPENFPEYFSLFSDNSSSFDEFLTNLLTKYKDKLASQFADGIQLLLDHGCLAKRLQTKGLNQETYKQLIYCLTKNTALVP